jgi:hypothetical protein
VESARADGFGVVDAHVLDLSLDGASPIRIWNEGDGDFWIEIGGDHAAWWRQDARRVALASVLMALLDGEYTIRNGRITVIVDGEPVQLRRRG